MTAGSRVAKRGRHIYSARLTDRNGFVVWIGYDTDLRSYFVSVFRVDAAGRELPVWDAGQDGVGELVDVDALDAAIRRRNDDLVDWAEFESVTVELTTAAVVGEKTPHGREPFSIG